MKQAIMEEEEWGGGVKVFNDNIFNYNMLYELKE